MLPNEPEMRPCGVGVWYLELALQGKRKQRRHLEQDFADLAPQIAQVGVMAVDVLALPALANPPNPEELKKLLHVRDVLSSRAQMPSKVARRLQVRLLCRLVLRLILPKRSAGLLMGWRSRKTRRSEGVRNLHVLITCWQDPEGTESRS
ncbi:hypothetical protein ACFC96_31840 [Streptomyces sp. NPDC055955]|uniref:hypothetical protein n=1 Tax=Streptomyces sp. NPDC055955 TaxID=3345665 RepID=UPI0035E0D74C